MKLGLVTYQMGQDMDLETLLTFCEQTGLEGVELRTTHAHGVEPSLSKADRETVRQRFADSPVTIVGLGSVCEYHSPDSAELDRQIEETKRFAQLAADVGAQGVKVRPNGHPDSIARERSCEQIGRAWNQVAATAADLGIEIRMEVHGHGTQEPTHFLQILAHAEHPNATVCWNSNPTDIDASGSIVTFFEAVKERIGLVHITEIGRPQYPWHDLFTRLTACGYTGFCLAEIAYNPEPERFMTYYRTLFDFYRQRAADRV